MQNWSDQLYNFQGRRWTFAWFTEVSYLYTVRAMLFSYIIEKSWLIPFVILKYANIYLVQQHSASEWVTPFGQDSLPPFNARSLSAYCIWLLAYLIWTCLLNVTENTPFYLWCRSWCMSAADWTCLFWLNSDNILNNNLSPLTSCHVLFAFIWDNLQFWLGNGKRAWYSFE